MSAAAHGRRARHHRERGGGVFAPTITLARISGIEVGLNWTWIGIFALILWSLAGVEFPADVPGRAWPVYAAMGAIATVAFFGSLILHELGHALQARREGIRTEGITLWLFGGVAKLAGDFPSAGAELRIAVAGPAVTLAIGGTVEVAAALWPHPGAARTVLEWLGYVNLALLAFNLVPALPLDGGRVLRALLWARSGDLTSATRRATRIGGALATVLIVVGIVETLQGALGGIWLALIGWFVLEAGRAEQAHVLTRNALGDTTVGMLMTRDPIVVAPGSSLAEVAAELHGAARHTAYPVVADGAVVGLFALHALALTPHPDWKRRTVAECMIPSDQVPRLEIETPAGAAAEQLAQSRVGRAPVIAGGRLVGILSLTDIARTIALGRPL